MVTVWSSCSPTSLASCVDSSTSTWVASRVPTVAELCGPSEIEPEDTLAAAVAV